MLETRAFRNKLIAMENPLFSKTIRVNQPTSLVRTFHTLDKLIDDLTHFRNNDLLHRDKNQFYNFSWNILIERAKE